MGLRPDASGHLRVSCDFQRGFWNWKRLEEALGQVLLRASESGGEIELQGLYDRSQGTCTRSLRLTVEAGALVLVPGCYLIGQCQGLGPKVLLWCDRQVGLERKLQREYDKKHVYPDPVRVGEVVTEWELVEHPSFAHHLLHHGCQADVTIDTSELALMHVIHYGLPTRIDQRTESRGTKPEPGLQTTLPLAGTVMLGWPSDQLEPEPKRSSLDRLAARDLGPDGSEVVSKLRQGSDREVEVAGAGVRVRVSLTGLYLR
jgi:hypothetical protein